MDDQGHIYKNPSPALIAERKLMDISRPLTEQEQRTQKIGRNSPCGCGSGVKFKKCCYRPRS